MGRVLAKLSVLNVFPSICGETDHYRGISMSDWNGAAWMKREKAQRESSARLASRKMMRIGAVEDMARFGAAGCGHAVWGQANMREMV